MKRPAVTVPASLACVAVAPVLPVNVNAIVDDFFVFHTHVPVHFVGLGVFDVARVVQLPDLENFAVIDAVALVTPPPVQPTILATPPTSKDVTGPHPSATRTPAWHFSAARRSTCLPGNRH